MPNTTCLTGPAFSLTGDQSYADQHVHFLLSFDNIGDQSAVDCVEWFLDGILVIDQSLPEFSGDVTCGSHHIGARILSSGAWSGVKSLAFQTCKVVLSTLISGPGTVDEGESAVYQVIITFSDGTTRDVTADYIFTSPDGDFNGSTFTPGPNDSGAASRQGTITATKAGAAPINKQITITDTTLRAGVLVVDLYNNDTLDVIGLINNAEVIESHVAAYTGNNVVPPSSITADALILASDVIPQEVLNWRFEFNIARLSTYYPASATFGFFIKVRASAAGILSGAFGLKTFNAQMDLAGSPGSYIPVTTGGGNFGQKVNFNTEIVGGANGSHAEADLTMAIELTYHVAEATITYVTHVNSIEVNDFDYMTVKYQWVTGDGTDLDVMVGFENNHTADDGLYVGYGQPNATVPANASPQSDAYLWWGTDNTSAAGVEAVLIGMEKFVAAFPSSPDVVEVGLYAVWFGPPLSGDFTVALVTYKGGTMSLSGTDFVNTGGTQVSSHTINANTKISNNLHTPANAYKVGSVKYTKSTQSAVIQIN